MPTNLVSSPSVRLAPARSPWVVVGLLWGVALLNYLDRQMLATMRPAMQADITDLASAALFGQLMAIFLWIYGLMSPVAGVVADRLNRRWLIVGSLAVWSGVTLLMGYATTFEQLYALRAVMGVSEALYIPAGLSLIADVHPSRTRSLAVGIHMTGLYAGQALGGFGATLAGSYSWEATFRGFGAVGLFYALVLAVFLREARPQPALLASAAGGPLPGGSVWQSLQKLLTIRAFWVLMLLYAIPSLPGWATKNWLPTLLSGNLGMDMAKAGPLATLTIAASSLVGVLVGGLLSDRLAQSHRRGRLFVSAAGLLLTVPALLLLGFGQSLGTMLGAAVCFGIGYGLFDANNMPILCQFVPPSRRATAYGLMNMTGVFAGAAITHWLGRATDAGHLGRDVAALAGMVLLALLVQLTVLRPPAVEPTDPHA